MSVNAINKLPNIEFPPEFRKEELRDLGEIFIKHKRAGLELTKAQKSRAMNNRRFLRRWYSNLLPCLDG